MAHVVDSLDPLRQIADTAGGVVTAVTAADLAAAGAAGLPRADADCVELLIGERHPPPTHDDPVIHFARERPCRARLVFHVSLDEPLLRDFAGEWGTALRQRLGMPADESIESPTVSRRIQAAQRALAQECARGAASNPYRVCRTSSASTA